MQINAVRIHSIYISVQLLLLTVRWRRSFAETVHLQLALVLEVNALDVTDQPGTEKRRCCTLYKQT